MQTISLQDYKQMIGQDIGVSDWMMVDQSRINEFAKVTEDFQFIHIDEEKASETAFGGTIAHGFLVLSLMPVLSAQITPSIEGAQMMVNYGCNSLRFMSPVRAGKSVRLRSHLENITEKSADKLLITTKLTFEIQGEDRPALIAEWLTMAIMGDLRR